MSQPAHTGIVKESQNTLAALDENDMPLEERVSNPAVLRTIHEQFKHNDEESAANRSAVQELINFVPPFDPQELSNRGQADRFNVNFGMVSAIVNEAVGSYLDIFTTPTALLELTLNDTINSEDKDQWAAIMSEEFTTMLRSWDASTPNILLLDNRLVAHGIGIPWFEDSNNISFEVGDMEDFNFDDDAVAISSKVECTTVERQMSVAKLYSKIAGKHAGEDGYTSDGWNVQMVKDLIKRAQPGNNQEETWDYEKVARRIKANRITGGKNLPSVEMIWGFVRELDGTYSVYAASDDHKQKTPTEMYGTQDKGMEQWVFRQRHRYKDANQAFQIFAFGVGDKNNIHTIRGLGYFLYEAGQADNVAKCKILDAGRMRASEIYQPSGGVESEKDMQMIDIGHAVIIPQSLKSVQQPAGMPLDRTAEAMQSITREVMDRHSGGLASQGLMQNPGARRSELQVAAELDHMSKLLNFAINLYYPPFEKLLRELARRAFTQTQTDLETIELVKDMKRRIIERGVPKEMMREIDLKRSKVSRVMGAGSRGTRMLIFSQMSQLFAEMDPNGKERFTFDWATEMVGHDKAVSYFGRPGERRGHIDISIARLENARLKEGDYIDPTPGENQMVHLETHILEGLEPGLDAVQQGMMPFDDYVLENISLFQHTVDTLETTTVHESVIGQLNALRQRTQQIGEVIQNGLKEINAKRRREGQGPLQPGQEGQEGEGQQQVDPAQEKANNQRLEASTKIEIMIAEATAKLEAMRAKSSADIEIMKQKAMAQIHLQSIEQRDKMERARIIERAKSS